MYSYLSLLYQRYNTQYRLIILVLNFNSKIFYNLPWAKEIETNLVKSDTKYFFGWQWSFIELDEKHEIIWTEDMEKSMKIIGRKIIHHLRINDHKELSLEETEEPTKEIYKEHSLFTQFWWNIIHLVSSD